MTLRTVPRANQDAWSRAWIVLGLTMLVRTVVAARYPLVPDEAYFWEWSRRLAAGYFDHPPGIAWTIAGGTAVLGDTVLGIRLLPLACNAAAAAALMLAARDLGGDGAALRAVVVFALLPLSSGLILATPDAPLAAAVSIAMLAALRATRAAVPAKRALPWWMLAGIASGVGMATKLSGVLVPLGVALACAAMPAFRPLLRTPGPWVAALLASLVMVPVLLWNSAHDWIAFRFQLGHGFGAGGAGGVFAAGGRVLEFAGGQLLVTAVLPGIAMAAVLWHAARGEMGNQSRLLAVVTLTGFVVFILSAVRRHSEPNWTAVAYPALVILFSASDAHVRQRRLVRTGLALAAVMVALGYTHAVGIQSPLASVGSSDPFSRARGWRALASTMAARAAAERSSGAAFLAADRYQDAAQIAFHAPGQPVTFSLNLAGRANQYEYWTRFADTARIGDHLIVAVDEAEPSPAGNAIRIAADTSMALPVVIAGLAPHFAEVRPDTIVRGVGGRGVRRIWVLRHWNGTFPGHGWRTRAKGTPGASGQ